MASSVFPTVPYYIFCVLEPISLLAGWIVATFDTTKFINDQYPRSGLAKVLPNSENSTMLAYQLGNVYGLMFLLSISILQVNKDKRVAQLYLLCLAIADIGHVAPTASVLGWDRVADVASWNSMLWGNIGFTVFLFVMRVSTLLGVFGSWRSPKGKQA